MPRRRVSVVPHTHWDREWYEPFQTFRLRLVDTVDQLLSLLDADPSYSHFLLDGQMAVVDDYLEVRPEAEEQIRRLAGSGRLSMGPWYILMDEFLVSGETIVRDLQMGMARAAAFGGAMQVGYLPDMFGHIAQMPQILRQAGLTNAVVWRGVPSQVMTTAFWWEAPDGSTVRAEYLPRGYGNAANLPDDAKALVRRMAAYEIQVSEYGQGDVLWMNGSDHLAPQPALGRVVSEANDLQDDYSFEITSLSQYLSEATTDGLRTLKGELRSGAKANVLMGVLSNRVDVKRSAALTEIALERRAEPFSAFYFAPTQWPHRLFELAWLEVVRNCAHDSICACSVDEVVDAVLHRFSESRQIANGISERALRALSLSMADPGPTVVNPSARKRSAVVELIVPATEPPSAHVQVVSQRASLPGSMTLDATTVQTVLGMIQGSRIDDDAWVQEVRIEEDESGIEVIVHIGQEEVPGFPIQTLMQDLRARLANRPDSTVKVTLDQPPIRRIAARAATVPGFGWRAFEATPLEHPVTVSVFSESVFSEGEEESSEIAPAGSVVLSNGLVRVVVSSKDGTFSINGLSGFGRLVDGGDLGDSYNYSPPRNDAVVDNPESVTLEVIESGPVRASVTITSLYRWPDRIDTSTSSRVGDHEVRVETKVELRADEKVTRVTTTLVNPSRDHRLRVHLPLPEPAQSSEAECAFAAVTRGLVAEGRPEELGLPTFPSRRFVRAGGLTLCHLGLHEYELVDLDQTSQGQQAHTLAVTLLRSTGMLSRVGMTYRPVPAGPLTPVEGLQMVDQRIEAHYAIATEPIDPWEMAEDFVVPLEVITSLGGGWRPPSGSSLSIEGAQVSAVRRQEGRLEVRVFNPTDQSTTVDLAGSSGWLIDLRGLPVEPFEGSFQLRPFGIATLRITSG